MITSLALFLAMSGPMAESETLRVMTWNVHYFVPVTVNAEGKVVTAPGGAESVIAGIVTAAQRYNLDVIALQEATPRKHVMEAARRLGWHGPQVDRLLDLRHKSRMDQLEAAFRALGRKLGIEVVKAA